MFSKSDIERYFIAEKQESLLFLIVGIAAIVLGLLSYFYGKTPFFKGAAIPLIIIGLIQGVVGYTVYARSDEDRKRNVYAFDMNPSELKGKELPRMQKVNQNFVIYRWVEIVLAIVSVFLLLYYRGRENGLFLYGLGMALAVQSLFMLGADYFAEKRAAAYTAGIESFLKGKK
jgi:uncharacterized membrane protein